MNNFTKNKLSANAKQLNAKQLNAQARDTSRRDWLSHAAMMVGLAATSGLVTRVQAQDDKMTGDMAGDKMMDGKMMDSGMMVPAPLGDQAVPGASIVPDTKLNPNNPALTIPGAAKKASAGDADILNFALGLEYLESTFYASIVDANNARSYLSPEVAMVARKLADDEAAHVTAILDVLNRAKGTPIEKPNFQFPANVYVSQIAFLELASVFEVTGTGAYLGAAPKLDSVDALKFAASIYGIEARHTSLIRSLVGKDPSPTALEIALEVPEVQKRVAPFIIV